MKLFNLTPEDRFWKYISKTTKCWTWKGSLDSHGYGRMFVGKDVILAHRYSYVLNKGKIPKGKGYHGTCVYHTCGNPRCVRPKHLFLGSK